jgi:peptidoglycan/xylan/chitin deacetylase (PgdA/CDA1 family)
MPEASESVFHGRRGAVSLTFDDGTANQLDHAVPPLEERGLRGTFYLNPRASVMEEHVSEWRSVAASGHEIGNHTLSHPCPGSITIGRRLEDLTLDDIEADIVAAGDQLKALAPNQAEWSFAYPCYATYVGRGRNRRSYVPVVAEHFLAGRAGGEVGFANDPTDLDLAALVATPVERLSADEIILLVDRLTGSGRWLILVFHDIEGEVLPVSKSEYARVLDFLASRAETVLTAPVIEIARRVVDSLKAGK